jgi:hypothetical protein
MILKGDKRLNKPQCMACSHRLYCSTSIEYGGINYVLFHCPRRPNQIHKVIADTVKKLGIKLIKR